MDAAAEKITGNAATKRRIAIESSLWSREFGAFARKDDPFLLTLLLLSVELRKVGGFMFPPKESRVV